MLLMSLMLFNVIEYYSGVFTFWIIFLKSMTETDFRKSPGLYINSSERVCDGFHFWSSFRPLM